MKKISLNTNLLYYFGLYLVKKSEDDTIQSKYTLGSKIVNDNQIILLLNDFSC